MPTDDYTPNDLTHHLRGMIDSLDEHVTPEDIVPVLHEALQMSLDQDRGRAAHDARVRAEAGAQALRDAADDLAVRANEPGLIERADRYQGYYAGVRSAMQDAETKLRARADTITQEASSHPEGARVPCGCDLTGTTPPAVHIVDGHEGR